MIEVLEIGHYNFHMFRVVQILVSPHSRRRVLAAAAAIVLAGCGQKGPLFMPSGEAGQATVIQTLTPAPSATAVVPLRAASSLPPSGTAAPVRNP